MKRSKFSEEQVVRIPQEAESGKSVREVCRAHGVSEGTFYEWKRKCAGMETQDVRRLRELEAENAALKRIVADQALLLDATGRLIRENGWTLEGARTLMAQGISQRSACKVAGVSRRALTLPPAPDRGQTRNRVTAYSGSTRAIKSARVLTAPP